MNPASLRAANRRTAGKALLAVTAMFGFGYALVPLYDIFCDITGLNGKTRNEAVVVSEMMAPVALDRTVTVEFVASTNIDAPWDFKPAVTRMDVHPGQFYQTSFSARNLTTQALTGQAVPSVAPGRAAIHFQKIECFCFNQQDFGPGESKDMPLVFRIDPGLAGEVSTVTLSYTFFRAAHAGGIATINRNRAERDAL